MTSGGSSDRSNSHAPATTLIGLGEALSRLSDKISDREAAAANENLDKATKALGLPEPDPDVRLRKMRHEASIKQLDDALSNGELRLLLRGKDGTLIQLTSAEWRESAFRRDTIIGGQWRDPLGPHDLWEAVLTETAFHAWCSQFVVRADTASAEPHIASAEQPTLEPRPPMKPIDWLMEQPWERGETARQFARRIAPVMAAQHRHGKVEKAWAWGTIANNISKLELRPGASSKARS
jgi:hypothetical protein